MFPSFLMSFFCLLLISSKSKYNDDRKRPLPTIPSPCTAAPSPDALPPSGWSDVHCQEPAVRGLQTCVFRSNATTVPWEQACRHPTWCNGPQHVQTLALRTPSTALLRGFCGKRHTQVTRHEIHVPTYVSSIRRAPFLSQCVTYVWELLRDGTLVPVSRRTIHAFPGPQTARRS